MSNFIPPANGSSQGNYFLVIFFGICPPPGLLPELGLCERYMTLTLDVALLICRKGPFTEPGVLHSYE